MHSSIKNFLEKHAYLLDGDHEDQKEFFKLFSQYKCGYVSRMQMFDDVFYEAGLNFDDVRWELFDDDFVETLSQHRGNLVPGESSNAWSRLQWLLAGMDEHGFKYEEVLKHVRANQQKLGVHLRTLPEDCCYEDPADVDLGWFNIDAFRRECGL